MSMKLRLLFVYSLILSARASPILMFKLVGMKCEETQTAITYDVNCFDQRGSIIYKKSIAVLSPVDNDFINFDYYEARSEKDDSSEWSNEMVEMPNLDDSDEDPDYLTYFQGALSTLKQTLFQRDTVM